VAQVVYNGHIRTIQYGYESFTAQIKVKGQLRTCTKFRVFDRDDKTIDTYDEEEDARGECDRLNAPVTDQ